MKKFLIGLAMVGAIISILAVSTMDYYTKELISDFPAYLYGVFYGGVALMIPVFVYDGNGGK